MNADRPTKRRKLDISQPESQKKPTAANSGPRSTTNSQEGAAVRDVDNVPKTSSHATNGAQQRSTAHEAWREAKAKSQALRGKRAGYTVQNEAKVDVYEDIEGAHSHQSLVKKQAAPRTSTPVKKQLGPLRNQKSSTPATASPSKGGGFLGFFKQFHQPKAASEATPTKPSGGGDGLANGVAVHDTKSPPRDTTPSVHDDSDTSEDEEQPSNQSPAQPHGKASWKGWAYGEKPKKTFEDEIRELESAARVEAEKDETQDAVETSGQKRSHRIRVSDRNEHALERKERKESMLGRLGKQGRADKTPKASRRNDAAERSVERKSKRELNLETDELETRRRGALETVTSGERDSQTSAKANVKPQQKTKPTALSSDLAFLANDLQQIQTVLLEKLSGRRRISLTNLESEYSKVSNLISQTVTAGESNSMLLIGARGSGKSALVQQIIHEQTEQHRDDFHIVKLNGFIHTDDKIALREIWRQLGREMELDEEESTSRNYADTLTTLLALLSHPAELGREESDQVTKSVIFVLDEFDLFVGHPRQTLLYNLFDITQSRKAPIAVLGLTTRIDVTESLEKRVKSRFSHRYVHLGLAKSFVAFHEACKAAITFQYDELSKEELESLGALNETAKKLEKASKQQEKSAMAQWNTFVDELLAHEVFAHHLRRIYYTTKSAPDFHAMMLMLVSTMPLTSATTGQALREHFVNNPTASSTLPPDSKLTLLNSLSSLQLALLICAARLTAIHNTDVVPFAQAYEEYKILASKAKLQASASGALAQGAGSRVWSKDVGKGAWEDLIECGLVIEDGSRGGRVDVGLEEIGLSGVELGSWGRWCREI